MSKHDRRSTSGPRRENVGSICVGHENHCVECGLSDYGVYLMVDGVGYLCSQCYRKRSWMSDEVKI